MEQTNDDVRLINNKITYIRSYLKDYERFLAILPSSLRVLGIGDHQNEITFVCRILAKIDANLSEKQILKEKIFNEF